MLMTVMYPPRVEAPEIRSYPPNTITVTTGTGTGTVDDLYSVDDEVYSVLEEDVGASSTLTATEEWIVEGTLDSGIFPDDTQTQDGTGVVYLEADDDSGALTGDNIYLNPTGAGTYTEWDNQWPAATFHWDKVDEDPHDGAATMVMTLTVTDDDTYAMEDQGVMGVGVKESGTITTVVWCEIPVNGVDSGSIKHDVYTGILFRSAVNHACIQGTWTNTTEVWATNPSTGLEWTLAEINAVEAGMYAQAQTDRIDVTSVGILMPLQALNYVLDVRHNVTAIPAGRENYLLTMRALTTPGEDIAVSVYDHVAPGWDAAFTFTTDTYATETFALVEADHVNAGEVWLRYTDVGGDAVVADGFDIDLVQVRAWDVEYTLDVAFNWLGLGSQRDPRLSVVGYKSDAGETFTLQVQRTGVWVALDADILEIGMSSWAFTLAPADVEAGALQVRFIDNDITDNTATTIYLDLLTVRIQMEENNPAAPIDVYVDVAYDLWANEIILSVQWVQVGGPEPAVERGKWVTVWADGVEIGSFTIDDGARRIPAPWSYFDGRDHNITVIGAVNVDWPTWQGWQTYFSDPELENVSNFPRFAVLMFGLLSLLALIAVVAVRAITNKRREDDGPK